MKRALAALRRALSTPRRLRATPEGKWFLLITFGVGAAAVNTGNNLLYLALTMNMSLIVLSGILSEWALRGISVEVRESGEAFARRESFLAVSCAFPGRRPPLLSFSVAIPIGGERVAVRLPEFPNTGAATRVVPFRPRRRGLYSLAACTVSTPFPFGFFEKSAQLTEGSDLVIFPEPTAEGDPDGGERRAGPDEGPASAPGQGPSIRGVRDLAPGDPIRDIHWKASAKRGIWVVKERERDPGGATEIRLPVPAPPEIFEPALSRACALVLQCEREGRPYSVLYGSRRVVSGTEPDRRGRALTFLALAAGDGSTEGGAGPRHP